MGQERTVIKTVDRPGQSDADHSAGMTACIRIKDKNSDLIPYFKHAVLFQGIDGRANRRTPEFESAAQLILGGEFFSALYFAVAYIAHQQLFGSLCFTFSHKKPAMKTKNSLRDILYHRNSVLSSKIKRYYPLYRSIISQQVQLLSQQNTHLPPKRVSAFAQGCGGLKMRERTQIPRTNVFFKRRSSPHGVRPGTAG